MINKKADEVKIGPLIKIILVVLVIVIVFFGVFSFDVYKFFKNLPDFFGGGSRPDELFIDAVVYGINVRILINDGEGRCVVAEVPVFQGENNDWLKSYGVRQGELEINKEPVKTMGWVSNKIIEDQELFDKLEADDYYLIGDILHDINNEPSYYGGQRVWGKEYIINEIDKISDNEKEKDKFFEELIKDDELTSGRLEYLDKLYKDYPEFVEVVFTFLDKREGVFGKTVDSLKLIEGKINGKNVHLFQSVQNPIFAIRGQEKIYYSTDEENWNLYSDIIKNQIIKQDLMKACYSETDDFKETQVLGKPVTLLLKDNDFAGDGKCVIYNSDEDRSLEHYSIKYNVLGTLLKSARLYELGGNGNWENIESRLPSPEEIKVIPLMQNLIQEEKNFISDFLKYYELDIGYMFTRIKYLPQQRDVENAFKKIQQGDINGFSVLFKYSDSADFVRSVDNNLQPTALRFSPKKATEIYNSLYQKNIDIVCEEDICFVKSKNNDHFRVRGGIIYELKQVKKGFIIGLRKTVESWEPVTKEDYRYAYHPIDDWNKLVRERSIKLDLIEKCKK